MTRSAAGWAPSPEMPPVPRGSIQPSLDWNRTWSSWSLCLVYALRLGSRDWRAQDNSLTQNRVGDEVTHALGPVFLVAEEGDHVDDEERDGWFTTIAIV